MKVLVAGKGFIGEALGNSLEENHEVQYLDRSDAEHEHDITGEFEIDEEFDVVYHMIGLPPGFCTEKQYRKVHVEGTRNLLDAVDAEKIVYVSALGAGSIDHSFHRTKGEAEKIIKESGRKYTIVRPSIVYHLDNKILGSIRKMSITRIFPDLSTMVQPIRRSDLVDLLEECLDDHEGEVLNAAGPEVMSMGELAAKIYAEENRKCLLVPYHQFLAAVKLKALSFLPPPFRAENINLLRNDNVVYGENDAEKMVELEKI